MSIVAVIMGGSVVVGTRAVEHTRRTTETFDGAARRLVVDVDGGHVRVTGTAEPTVVVDRKVRYGLRKPSTSARVRGNDIVVSGQCGRALIMACHVDVAVRVPAGMAVDVRNHAGSVDVGRVTGAVKVDTDAGSVHVSDLTGSAALTTNAGSITGSRMSCTDVQATTNAGSVRLDFTAAPDHVRAETDAGNVDVTLPDGQYRIDAHSSVGFAGTDLENDPASPRQISARTSAGNVRIHRHAAT